MLECSASPFRPNIDSSLDAVLYTFLRTRRRVLNRSKWSVFLRTVFDLDHSAGTLAISCLQGIHVLKRASFSRLHSFTLNCFIMMNDSSPAFPQINFSQLSFHQSSARCDDSATIFFPSHPTAAVGPSQVNVLAVPKTPSSGTFSEALDGQPKGSHLGARPTKLSTRNIGRNMHPCGRCSDRKVKVRRRRALSPNALLIVCQCAFIEGCLPLLCTECVADGLKLCPPHIPWRERKVVHPDGQPKVSKSPPSSDYKRN